MDRISPVANFLKIVTYFLISRMYFATISLKFSFLHVIFLRLAGMFLFFGNSRQYVAFCWNSYPVTILAVAYFLTKAFGIFGIIEKYNKFKQFLIILFLCILFKLSFLYIPFFIKNYDFLNDISNYLVFAWILRKFFNFLTLKFPYPFKEIGYIFSFEYYRNLFLNKKINDEE